MYTGCIREWPVVQGPQPGVNRLPAHYDYGSAAEQLLSAGHRLSPVVGDVAPTLVCPGVRAVVAESRGARIGPGNRNVPRELVIPMFPGSPGSRQPDCFPRCVEPVAGRSRPVTTSGLFG